MNIKNGIFRFTIALSMALTLSVLAAEPVKLTQMKQNDLDVIKLENYRISLTLSPTRGGAVTEYSDKLAPGNIILPNKNWGLFMDHFQEQPWPGELLEKPYEFQIVSQTPEEAKVKVWTKSTGSASGDKINNKKISNIILEKTYTLKADSPALYVEVKLSAPADESKTCAYWIQHVCRAGKEFDASFDRTFRPTARGVRSNGKEGNSFLGSEDFIIDISAPWTALLDTREKRGIVSVADYDEVSRLYANCGNATSEIMFNTCYIPKGTSKTYLCRLLPLAGFERISHADDNLLASLKIATDNKGGGSAEFAVAKSAKAISSLSLAVSAVSASDPAAKPVDCGSVSFTDVGDAPKAASLVLKNLPPDPVVIRVVANGRTNDGKDFSAAFEDFHAGAYQWGDNIMTDMRSPLYSAKRKPQALTLAKPKEMKLVPAHQGGGKTLFFEGLLDEEYNVADAIHSARAPDAATITLSYYRYASQFFGSLTDFPYDYEELLKHSCIILGGASASGFKPIGVEMLHDYLMAGGGMVVLGSYGAYGRSHLKGSKLGDAFPFAFEDNPCALGGPSARKVAAAANLPQFASAATSLSKNASCWWTHPVTLKDGAKAVLLADGAPIMSAWEYGPNKARIVCIAAAPMGEPAKGETPFWKDPKWSLLLRDAIWWVQKQDRRFE
jgi:hypothetical protein